MARPVKRVSWMIGWSRTMVRGLAIYLFAVSVYMPLAAESRDVLAFVEARCAGCHNATSKSGNLDFAALQSPKTFEENRETWEKVVAKLKMGQMPPPGLPRPPAETVNGITNWLAAEFARQDS